MEDWWPLFLAEQSYFDPDPRPEAQETRWCCMEHRLTWDPSICPCCHPPAPEHCPEPGSEPNLWVELQGGPHRQSLPQLTFLLKPNSSRMKPLLQGARLCVSRLLGIPCAPWTHLFPTSPLPMPRLWPPSFTWLAHKVFLSWSTETYIQKSVVL